MKTNEKLNAPMQLKTFYRYMNAHFPQVAIKKVMEDCCDTCIRIATELKRPNLSQEEKELLILCQSIHDEGSRNQRVLMRAAEAWGRSQSLPDGEFGEFLGRLALIPQTLVKED